MFNRKYSLETALLCTALLSCFFAWWIYEREPAIGEFLYSDTHDKCVHAYRVDMASCEVHREDPAGFFLTFASRASHSDDSVNGGCHPYLEVSLLFDKDPTPLIAAGSRFPVVLYSDQYDNLQSIVYNSVWADFSEASVTINESNATFIDATLEGLDSAGGGSKITMRARFMRTPGMGRSFSQIDDSAHLRITMK